MRPTRRSFVIILGEEGLQKAYYKFLTANLIRLFCVSGQPLVVPLPFLPTNFLAEKKNILVIANISCYVKLELTS